MKKYLGFFDYKESDTFRPTIESRIHLDYPTSKTICANGIPAIIEGGGYEDYNQSRDRTYERGDKMLKGGKCLDETIIKNIDEFKEGKILNMDLYNRSVNEEISQTLTEPNHNSQRLFDGLRIRKLTPKECWRLMGFDDEDFEKAEKVNSNTQLYKQAGNSIVVNVLEKILNNLIDKDESIKILELFGGIGACSKALERLGIQYEIADYVEIDKYAVKSFNAIHDSDFEPQDICEWDKDMIVDLIMHGSPCQDFSLAGKQAGGDEGSGTRSSLMYETVRIVEKLKPKYVIWENVKNVISKKHKHNFDIYIYRMEELGYTSYYQVLNAKDYGIPQNRERVFTISIRKDIDKKFEFPPKEELKLKLKDMLEDNVDEKYYLSEQCIQGRLTTNYQKYKLEENIINNKDIHPTILASFDGAPTLYVNNNTKQGYLEAQEGDGIDISSRMKYHRGNVQRESIQTITTSGGNDRGVVVKEEYDFSDLD